MCICSLQSDVYVCTNSPHHTCFSLSLSPQRFSSSFLPENTYIYIYITHFSCELFEALLETVLRVQIRQRKASQRSWVRRSLHARKWISLFCSSRRRERAEGAVQFLMAMSKIPHCALSSSSDGLHARLAQWLELCPYGGVFFGDMCARCVCIMVLRAHSCSFSLSVIVSFAMRVS